MRYVCTKTTSGLFVFLSLVVIPFLMLGCLQQKEQASTNKASTTWFAGATAAANVGGSPTSVKVSWSRADRSVTAYRIYSLRQNATGTNEWQEIDEVGSGETTFVDTQNLSDGTVYTYKVQAVDALTGKEDGNDVQVSTVTFYGIVGVSVTGKNTATIELSGLSGAYDSIHIYATPTGGSKTLVATVKGNPSTVDVSGLRSGVNYKFSANAYMSFLQAEDGNARTMNGQTWSDSFGSGLTTDTNYYYRGVLNVQGYGLAPNATSGPTGRQINLIWLPFSNANSSTKYKVVRSTTTSVDTTVSAVCTSTSTTSCVVCTVTGSQKCVDTNVAAPPQAYYYAITVMKTDSSGVEYTEELPCQSSTTNCSATDFLVTAHVPPDYMVLVQRDAANYEMCLNINAASDPRHKQRCVYVGLGAVPTTTGPNKPAKTYDSGYYDFGYNLFIDRYKVACNWTKSSSACGPNGCIDILSTDTSVNAPSGTLGNVGDVFMGFRNVWWSAPSCYIKSETGWASVGGTTTLTPDQLRTAVTNDPGPANDKHRPPLVFMTATSATQICSAQSTDYGNKRLLRHREYIVATPLPYISGEDNSTNSLLAFNAPNNTTCNPYPATSSWPVSLSAWLSSSNPLISIYYNSTTTLNAYDGMMGTRYFIGSTATAGCVSRFGIQDPLGMGVLFSDSFVRLNSTATLPPTVQASSSDFDSGNMDNGNFSLNGIQGPAFPGGPVYSYYTNQVYSLSSTNSCSALGVPPTSFIPPVGLPVCTWSGGAQSLRSVVEYEKTGQLGSYAAYGAGISASNYLANDSVNNYVMGSGIYGRYSFSIAASGSTYAKYGNLLCAVEAE